MATAFSLVLFVTLANAVVDLYVRGVARAAVDEAARSGAASTRPQPTAGDGHDDVLDGVVAAGAVRVTCREVGGSMRARGTRRAGRVAPRHPHWTMVLEGEVVAERVP